LEAAGFLTEGLTVYKALKVLKADSCYSMYVDIVRAKVQMPFFTDLADEAREFFAAGILHEQDVFLLRVNSDLMRSKSLAFDQMHASTVALAVMR
jgi:hypothetical protein